MCTRISLSLNGEALQQAFPMFHIPADWQARYNLSPGQDVLAVLNDGTKQAIRVFWGWRRPWEPQKSGLLVNARAESADRKPTFREAFTHRRCLVLADGFYEWQRVGPPVWCSPPTPTPWWPRCIPECLSSSHQKPLKSGSVPETPSPGT